MVLLQGADGRRDAQDRGRPDSWLGYVLAWGVFLGSAMASAAPGSEAFSEVQAWARNVGGPALVNRLGDAYTADDCSDPGIAGACLRVDGVRRTQSPDLHVTYRAGDQCFAPDLDQGTYTVTLYFTEAPAGAGERRVDVLIQGVRRLTNLVIPEAPPGRHPAAMMRGFMDVEVDTEGLALCVEGRLGAPLVSGVMVRQSEFSLAGWELSWAEEFRDPQELFEDWTAEEWRPGRVNHEEQAYTRRPENVRIENGVLILEAHTTGKRDPAYTSGRLHSWGHQAFRYGRLDIRARVPEGRGVWPALWLLPDNPYRYATTCASDRREWQGDGDCDAWPNSGEIDLMEHIGYEPGVVHGTVHTRDHFAGEGIQGSIVVDDLGRAFHTYSLVWEADAMAMFVDGVRYYTYVNEGLGAGQWPFDHPFHIVMNLAIGGDWGAAHGPVEKSALPRRLEVDYVRLYERAP